MRCIEDNLRFHQHHKIGVVENLIMQRLSASFSGQTESGYPKAQVAAIVGAASHGPKTEMAGEGFRGIEQCAAADANHHAAIVTGLSRQLLYIAGCNDYETKYSFASSPTLAEVWFAPQQWRVCRRSTPREKVVHQ